MQKAGARHDHEESTDQDTTGQGQQPVSRKIITQVLTFVNEQQAKLFTHFRGWSGSEAKCGPIKFLSIMIVHDRIPPNYDVKFSFIFQIRPYLLICCAGQICVGWSV